MVGSAVVDLFWLMYIFIFYNLSVSTEQLSAWSRPWAGHWRAYTGSRAGGTQVGA